MILLQNSPRAGWRVGKGLGIKANLARNGDLYELGLQFSSTALMESSQLEDREVG
jgi:hypothetical protein